MHKSNTHKFNMCQMLVQPANNWVNTIMTWWYGNGFRVTVPLWGIPLTKGQ